jgi:hypothetical protein
MGIVRDYVMNKFKILAMLLITLAVASCGGSSGGTITGNGGGDDGVGGTVFMGAGSTVAFLNQMLDLDGVTALAAGGSVGMSVIFVVDDGTGALTDYTDSVQVTFSSSCITQGLAVVSPSTTVTSVSGLATATYLAQGCDTGSGGEVITASANVNGADLTAQVNLVVAGTDVGSLQLLSAEPSFIGLKGSGGSGIQEQSTIRFRVVDQSSGPVAGKEVNFSLDTQVGGITLTPASSISDINGEVQTVVQSGTVATTLRVTATDVETQISTQSGVLTISTGIPHQSAFSMSLDTCNTNTFEFDGYTVPVNVILSDRFQNPVPDGTAITFTAEGGQIVNGCVTDGGGCSVNWTSADPRPGVLSNDQPNQSGGRVTILATAIGEESFIDEDGDFVYDAGEVFGDLEERFRDDNEDGDFDIGVDGLFLDFNESGTQDAADGTFNGLLCSSGCSPTEILGVSAEAVLVMGTSGSILTPSVNPVVVGLEGQGTVNLLVSVTDENGNFPPAGTVIKVTTATAGAVVGPSEYTVPDSCGIAPQPFVAIFAFEGGPAQESGSIFVEATTPAPNPVTTAVMYGVVVQDMAP